MKEHYWLVYADVKGNKITLNVSNNLGFVNVATINKIKKEIGYRLSVDNSDIQILTISPLGLMTEEEWEN